VNLFLNFITAGSWIWAVINLVSVLIQLVPPMRPGDGRRAFTNFSFGIPAYAWLIARYLMH